MKVVVDINVIVSGLINEHSAPGIVLDRCQTVQLDFVVSSEMLDELSTVLARPKVTKRVPLTRGRQIVELLGKTASQNVTPSPDAAGVTDDEEDDIVLGTALTAEVDVLITGDRGLLAVGEYRGVRIMNPREFLDEWIAS